MTSRYRTIRVASYLLVLLLACAFAQTETAMRPSYGRVGQLRVKPQGWVVSIPTGPTANSTVSGTIEGGPPAVGGAPPPFAISIELNDWPHKTGVATFNPETGKWDFDIIIPPGSSGSTMRVVVIPFVGEPVGTTVKIL
ncbi:MAG: hypothetical protein ACI97A_002459 [Planctomycetota bacterium]|jgi:hypothetical protein